MPSPARPKRPPSPVESPPNRRMAPWAAIAVWFVFLLVYLAIFYRTPLSHSPGDRPIPRGTLLLMAFTPEVFWQTWTGGGAMHVAVLDRWPIALIAGCVLGLALSAGWGVLELLDLPRRLSRLETLVFSAGAGLNVLSTASLAAGLIGGQPRLLWAAGCILAPAALTAAGLWRRRIRPRSNPPEETTNRAKSANSPWGWLAAGVPLTLLILLGAMLPPWEFDVREYHLQAPKEWFLKGRIDFLPHNVYANMPLGAEALALPAMALMPGEPAWWWGALAGKTLMAAFAPLAALALFAAGRRFFSAWTGGCAALVYLSIPWVSHTAMAGLNDHVLGCYLFLAFYAFVLWRSSPDALGFLMLAGLFAGAAMACKYTGAVFVAAPLTAGVVVAALRYRTDPPSESRPSLLDKPVAMRAVLATSIVLAATSVGGGAWYVKNAVLAENPVYPLMYTVFDGRTRTPEKDAQWQQAHRVPVSEENGPYSLQRLGSALALVGWRSDWLSPLLLPLLMLAPFQTKNRPTLKLTAALLLFVIAAWWLFTHRIDRFWIPALPLAAFLAGAGGGWLAALGAKRLLAAVLAIGVCANGLVIASPWIGDNRFLVALDDLRTDTSDPETGYVGRVSPFHRYLNETVPPTGAVLLVGDAQPFDLEVASLYNTCFDDSLFEEFVKGRSAQDRHEALLAAGITHVYVNWNEIARYRSPGNYGFPSFVQPQVFDELIRQGILQPAWPEEAFAVEKTESGYPPPRIYHVTRRTP